MTYRTLNPYTEQVVREFPDHSDAQVEAALAAADALYRSDWCKQDRSQRLAVLEQLADLVASNRDLLARTMAEEMGKPLLQGQMEADLCADIARYYARNAEALLKAQPVHSDVGEGWIELHPIGVLLAVEPWNFPLYQLVRVVAPAIAVGNPVLYKHASIVPQCAALFEDLVHQAGAPQGAVSNLYISASKVAALIGDDRIQGVALTGSEAAGSKVAARAGEMLKKSTMELGGSDVFVVLDDADLGKAVEGAIFARLGNAGQVCTGAKRFVIHKRIAQAFTSAFIEAMQSAPMGDPLDAQTLLGPLASREGVEGLSQQVETAIAHGATVLTGGQRVDRPGFFYAPTVLTDVSPQNPAFYQEFFGPVALLFVVEDDDAAVTLANDSQFGLGGTIYSENIARARGLASRIETGMVFINTPTTSRPEFPFGGIKRSGFGRELGDIGIKEFVNRKLIVVAGG
ncbi:NAD-dependent succinate-semialdehyde dehydrogenase [Xanthomonas campestris pv. merremiae]|uniref:NAD-dependent succinate-semialdehyde dehydrogenase n=1 Tax=Xanthomonas citri TaxID=346 RepID=UPI000B5C252F|nr:NAD-dependent succinate-semialdehyde dehydrogenase [Xanthomonas citri]ASK94982.1 succinate-semialdehyde dehydrogenase [Xanthomonas citri pv. vignicola]MBV6839414.1 NAD-dependent succinate-semialdehyde dehydrogenase [Xanthomonas campestris pv. merremiae]MBZ3934153.1 succinate-semialdehyde dehydrogenase [Xanthomonas campestris pv. merremiae]MCC8567192.1 NAD-dependent succinate-semialdehyde dehydrogenase [Xanthomonas citri pv. fuscans]